MVRLSFSNALEPLTAALARDVHEWRAGDVERLLLPLPVAVPDRLVARYLNLEIAKLLGVSVNLRFPFLSGVFESCLTPQLASRLLTRERLTERLLIALGDDDLLSKQALAPARNYVHTGDPDSSAARRAELALELTRLFIDYQASRPLELAKLGAESEFGGVDFGWQRELWNAAVAPTSGEPESMKALAPLILGAKKEALKPPPALFVVGGSTTSLAHRLILARLAQLTDVYIYAFNPCREFWEDIEKSPTECPALAYWGGAGRAPVKQLSELADFDFGSRFIKRDEDSALGRLANDVLERTTRTKARRPLANDNSIRIVSAPNIRRELETIGENIWTLVRQNEELSLTDVGVLLAGSDLDLYEAQIGAVFGGLSRLPHHLSLVPLTFESRVAEAIGLLIELPLGGFTRPQMLRVLTHPALIGADLEIDPADWVRWVRDLGVFFGGDATVHRGTYLEGDVYHWDQALLRLSLGACVENDPNRDAVTLGSRVLLPHPQTSEKRRSAAKLGLLARSLIADVTWMQRQAMSLSQWADVLWRYSSAYVSARSDRESSELGRCVRALTQIGDPRIKTPVAMKAAIAIAQSALSTLETRRGEPLTDGVCVARLSSPPLVPFRHLFIAGLSGGSFPSSAASGIDARADNRRASEPSASQRDRYAFLHALLAARESVTLSYVGRDPQTGENLPPSSVVAELSHLTRSELGPRAAAELSVEIPTWAHDDPQTETRGVNLAGRLRARAKSIAPAKGPAAVARSRRRMIQALRVGSSAATRRLLGVAADCSMPELDADREISAAQLGRFLVSPIDAWGQSVLGLGDRGESGRTSETEPLDLSPLDRSSMTKEAVCSLAIERGVGRGSAAARHELSSLLRQTADRLLSTGTGPSGAVAQWQIDAALEEALTWWDLLCEQTKVGELTSIAVGHAHEGANIRELLPPLMVGDDPFVEAYSRMQLVAADGSTQIYFHRRSAPPSDRTARAIIDHLLLAALGRVQSARVSIFFVGTAKTSSLEIDAFSRQHAKALVADLVADLFTGGHAYELPGARIFDNHLAGRDLLEGVAAQALKRMRNFEMKIVRRPGDFSLPENLGEILARRYQPILARLRRTR